MKILYISQYFPPEIGAPSARVSELSRHWVKAGNEVTVLTGFPNHPTGRIHPEYRSRFRRLMCREVWEGVRLVRTWLLPLPNRKAWERMLNYLSFLFSASLTGTFLPKPDVVIATSPQLLVGLAGYWVSRVKRVPLVFEVRDLWPESITASGMGHNAGPALKALSGVAGFLYRRAEHIVVVTPAFKRELQDNRAVDPRRISVVLNGVETDLFSDSSDRPRVRKDLGLNGAFVVSYVGTLGMAHGLETLLEVASILMAGSPKILFLVVGDGAERDSLRSIVSQRGLKNVLLTGALPRQQIPGVIAASDACTVLLRKQEVFKTVIPTKMLECMAASRPVILGVEGQAKEILDEAQAGIAVKPENVQGLADAVLELYQDRDQARRLGRNGRQFILSNLTRKRTAETYLEVLGRVVC